MNDRNSQLASLCQQGEKTFGQAEKFAGWMNHPNPIFDDQTPIALFNSGGYEAIVAELIRIDYGILA